MFSLIKQVFIVLLNFIESLARDQTKCLILNDEPCMVKPTLINLNPVELKYYLFIISLDKYSEKVAMSYLQKYVLQKNNRRKC